MKSRYAVIFAATLILVAGDVDAQTHLDTTAIDQAVISKLSAQFGINSKVITHLDLTQTFQTKSRWSLVVAKQPDEESSVEDGGGNRIGAVSLCFVENGRAGLFRRDVPGKVSRRENQLRFRGADIPPTLRE